MTLRKEPLTKKLQTIKVDARLQISDLIMPIQIIDGYHVKEEIKELPNIYKYSLDKLLEEVKELHDLGLRKILLSGPTKIFQKNIADDYDEDDLLQKAIRNIKQVYPSIDVTCVIDLQLLANDSTPTDQKLSQQRLLNLLISIAASYAEEGVDYIVPCHLQINDLKVLRQGLDEAGFGSVGILSDILEYKSSFCVALSNENEEKLNLGEIKSALMRAHQVEDDVDGIIIQPSLPILDIIHQVHNISYVPITVFQVGREYATLKQAIDKNIVSDHVIYDTALSIKRAGAEQIITYFAKDLCNFLLEQN